MRSALTLAALTLYGLSGAAAAQDMMRHVDVNSPDMVAAEMTRAQVEAALAAATSDKPADFTGRKLSGLDLSGLDLSGAVLRAARLNKTRLVGARLDRIILDQAWLLDALASVLFRRIDNRLIRVLVLDMDHVAGDAGT